MKRVIFLCTENSNRSHRVRDEIEDRVRALLQGIGRSLDVEAR